MAVESPTDPFTLNDPIPAEIRAYEENPVSNPEIVIELLIIAVSIFNPEALLKKNGFGELSFSLVLTLQEADLFPTLTVILYCLSKSNSLPPVVGIFTSSI